METLTIKDRVNYLIVQNLIAIGITFLIALILFFSAIYLSAILISGAPLFILIFISLSLISTTFLKTKKQMNLGWIVSTIVSYILAAPLTLLVDNYLMLNDPAVFGYEAASMSPIVWTWPLISALIYLFYGLYIMYKESKNS